jgi:hypothetical protein
VTYSFLSRNLSIAVVHFTPLKDRKQSLEKVIPSEITCRWFTERQIFSPLQWEESKSIFGLNPRRIGMDLGINSRSLSRTWMRAQIEGLILFTLSYLPILEIEIVTGDYLTWKKLPEGQLENLKQHISAMRWLLDSNSDFGLVLEDDALPTKEAWNCLDRLLSKRLPKFYVAFIGSGANLNNTKKRRDELNFYRMNTFSSRTAVATLYSKSALLRFLDLIDNYGIPDSVPIDVLIQVFLRKVRFRPFWQDPPSFVQGSESGTYESSFR